MQLITAAQAFTASWADLGAEVNCTSYNRLGIYLVLDINDTLNARIRALAKHAPNATNEYSLPITIPGASDVGITGEYFEFTVDSDQNIVLEIITNGIVPFVQFQIQAGTAGASPGQIDEADITFSNTQ